MSCARSVTESHRRRPQPRGRDRNAAAERVANLVRDDDIYEDDCGDGSKESKAALSSDCACDRERDEAGDEREGAQDERPEGPAQLKTILKEIAETRQGGASGCDERYAEQELPID